MQMIEDAKKGAFDLWTMDGDGELRLTIMVTLAQEKSHKISERVLTSPQFSRILRVC